MTSPDVIVLGLGGMGSAAAFHLARRGARVLGFEAHELAHDRGSSHGETRLIRKAYFESPAYVPLLERAYTLWDELSEIAGEPLLHRTGLLLFSRASAQNGAFARAAAVARDHGLTVEELGGAEVQTRFPSFTMPDDFDALWEPGAGYLLVERCVESHVRGAIARGADLRFGARVDSWSATAEGVEVAVGGVVHRAASLVICPGAWAPSVLAELGLPLTVQRVVQFWFDAPEALDETRGMPCFAFDDEGAFVYGFPRIGGTVKIAEHGLSKRAHRVEDPSRVDRTVDPSEAEIVKRFARAYIAGTFAEPKRAKTCMYTMTPDEHFVLDRHPEHENVHYACGFSGHGFKFASVMGECLAQSVLDARVAHPVAFLRQRWTR